MTYPLDLLNRQPVMKKLKAALDVAESAKLDEMGFGDLPFDSLELWLFDKLDARIFVAHFKPWLLESADWDAVWDQIEEVAERLGVLDQVKAIMAEFH